MPIINHRDKNVIFVVPPKNGCSTMRTAFAKYANLPEEMGGIDKHLEELNKLYMNKPLQENQKIIFIYRNIFNKFLSFVSNILNNRLLKSPLLSDAPLWPMYLKMFQDVIGVEMSLNTKMEEVFTFHDFLKRGNYQDYIQVYGRTDPHAFSNKYFLDEFLRMYTYAKLVDVEYMPIEKISEIKKKYFDLDDNLNSNITLKHTISVQKPYEELTIQDVATMTTDSLPPKLKLKIKELYSDDIDFFGDNNIDIMYHTPKKNSEALRKKYKGLRKLSECELKQMQLLGYFDNESILDKFDLEVYKENYPDVVADADNSDLKVVTHYINTGHAEGRVAMFFNIPDDFDPNIYKSLNEDIQNLSDLDAKIHYERYGFSEKRQYKI